MTPNTHNSRFGVPPSHNNYMRNTAPPKQFGAYQPQQKKRPVRHQRVRSLYDGSSSDDEEEEDDFDGFEKYTPPPKVVDVEAEKEKKRKEEEDYWRNNNTLWIVKELNKQYEYDTIWFTVPKMRNGKANGGQMKEFMEKSGLPNDVLRKIWRLSDLDKDGKMGNEEFALCMLLMEKAKKGEKLPDKLPKNYIPPSFRGKRLVKTPPKSSKPLPSTKSMPPNMNLGVGHKHSSAPVNSMPNRGGVTNYTIQPKSNSNNAGNIKIRPKGALPTQQQSAAPQSRSQSQSQSQSQSRSQSESQSESQSRSQSQSQSQDKKESLSESVSQREATPEPKSEVETSATVEEIAEKAEPIIVSEDDKEKEENDSDDNDK